MQRGIYLFFTSLICLLLFSAQVNAFVCVNNSADFQTALTGIASDNEIRLETAGSPYIILPDDPIAPGITGHFNVTASHSITISGGWDSGCLNQTEGSPGLTELVGRTTPVQTDQGGVL